MTEPERPPMTVGRVRGALAGVSSVGVSALVNLTVTVLAARNADPAEFGAVAANIAVATLVVVVARAMIGEALLLRRASRVAPSRCATTASLMLGIAIGTVVLGIGSALLMAGAAAGPMLIVLAFCLPGLLLTDTLRYTAFSDGQPLRATGIDIAWAGALAVALVVVGTDSAAVIWGAWCITGAAVGAALGPTTVGFARLRDTSAWVVANLNISSRYTLEAIVGATAFAAAQLLTGVVAGETALGEVRGALTLFGPLTVLYSGISAGVFALVRRQPGLVGSTAVATSTTSAALALLLTGAWLAVPDSLGEMVLGATWSGTSELLVVFGAAMVAFVSSGGASLGLRVLAAAHVILRVRLLTSAVLVGATLTGAAMHGAMGFAAGFGAASALAALLLWVGFVAERRRTTPSAVG